MTALLLALCVAAGVTYLVSRMMRGRSTAHAQVTQVVAAAKELPAGVALSVQDLTLVNWPTDVQLPGSFSKVDQVVGRP